MSNLALRLAVAVVGIPILIGAAIVGGYWLMVLVVAIQVVLLYEWHKIAQMSGVDLFLPAIAAAIAGLDLFVFGVRSNVSDGESLAAIYVWVLLVVFSRTRKPLLQLGYGSLFLIYAALPIALWVPIVKLSVEQQHGILGTLGLLFCATWLCDSAAYFGGRAFGRNKLYPQASPNKTIEGAVSGVIGAALLLPALAGLKLAEPKPLDYLFLPLIVGIAGQIGDLIESLMKREAGIKDSSHLIPGHGGFLDRFDSLLLSSPLFLSFLLLTSN